jgi:hypothetical protein
MVLPAQKGGARLVGRREERSQVSRAERRERLGHGAAIVVVEGDLAAVYAVERALFDRGRLAVVVRGAAEAAAAEEAGLVAVVPAGVEGVRGERVVRVTGEDDTALRALDDA